jgi:hypothetical protein
MKSRFTILLTITTLLLATAAAFGQATSNPKFPANANGRVMADEFGRWYLQSQTGISSGAQTVTLNGCYVKVGTAYEEVYPIAINTPLLISDGATNSETVTPTAVTQPSLVTGPSTVSAYNCTFTATFANSHLNPGFGVSAADGGLAAAINYALAKGIGVVTVDQSSQITNANLSANLVYQNAQIEDLRSGQLQYWNPAPLASTILATPTTLTSSTVTQSATPVGSSSWGGTVYACVAYVDVMGLEGPCSATYNYTSTANDSVTIAAPAASTGAVGYTVYLSLSGGSYALAYQIPVTTALCTPTAIETVTPACAVTNALYAQTGSNATFTSYPVNTSPLALLATTASTAGGPYVGTPGGRTTYGYVPSSHPAPAGMLSSYPAYTITAAAATTVPEVVATISVPASALNYPQKTLRICGDATEATAGSTSTITQFQFLLDAPGSNVAGLPLVIGGPQVTSTLVTSNADFWHFCQDLTTTVASASATGASLQATDGMLSESYGAGVAGVGSTGPTLSPTAVGSANLAGTAGYGNRIHVVYLHTTGTDAHGVTLGNLTVQIF